MAVRDELNQLKGLVKKKDSGKVEKQKDELKKVAKQVQEKKQKKGFFSFLKKKPKQEQTFSKSLSKSSPSDWEKKGRFAFKEKEEVKEQKKGMFSFRKKEEKGIGKEKKETEKKGIFSLKEEEPKEQKKPITERKDFLAEEEKKDFLGKEGEKIEGEKKDFLGKGKAGSEEKEGLNEKILGFYYSLEDKYYNFLDKVNEKIPVYKAIDPIDQIVPSFLLFSSIILIILILLLSFFLFPPVSEEKGKLILTLKKEDSTEVMSGYKVFFWVEGKKRTIKTDKNAQIILEDLEVGSKVRVEVIDVPKYEDFNKSISITETENFFAVKLKKKPEIDSGWSKKTVRFKEEIGETKRTVKEFLRVSFDCSDEDEIEIVGEESLSTTTTNGAIQIKTKDECGDVLVSIQSSEYEDIVKQVLPENKIITLIREEDISKGTIHIKLFDEEGELIQKKMKFSLFEGADEVTGYNVVSVFNGLKDFSIEPGTYSITVFDPDEIPEYSCGESEEKELTEGGEITFNITCSAVSEEDLISVKVVDSVSGDAVESTIELLQKKNNKFEFVASKEGSNVSFAVSEDINYIVLVSSTGYLLYANTTEILHKGDSLKVELVKATPANSGTAKIKVFDADGSPASVGKAYLRFGSGVLKDFRIKAYSQSIGFKGEAVIEEITPGKYYAEAITSEQKGVSEEKSIDKNKVTNFAVGMEKVRGTVKLKVTKLNSSAEIKDFEVEFFNALTSLKVPETDFVFDEKKKTFAFDAGLYYALISKEGYHITRSKDFIVKAKSRTTVNVVLPELGKDVEIHFNGLYKLNGQEVELIDLNKVYSAEFTLAVSPDPDLFYFNFLIGTGRGTNISEDSLYISSFNNPFPEEAVALKTTSFTGNYSTDFENTANLTQGNAKAVLVEFDDFDEREFEETAFTVSVEIKLNKEQLTTQTLDANNLILFFKALAVGNSFAEPEYYLDPEDDREFTSLAAYTYSNAKIHELSFCSNPFCYSYLVSSNSSDTSCNVISLGSISGVKLNCLYEFSSLILNNVEDYDSVDFSIENSTVNAQELDALTFNDYLIKTKSNEFTGNANNRIIQETIDLDEKGLIYSESDFTPTKLVKTVNYKIPAIRTALRDSSVIDENFHELRIRGDSEFNFFIEPEEIPAFTPTDLRVELLDQEGKPIEDAVVAVEITDSASGEIFEHSSDETDDLGEVDFYGSERIPALYPLSQVKISVELPDGTISSKTITVSDSTTFDFAPKSLSFVFSSIDSSTKTKDINFFDLSNGELEQEITGYSIDFSSNSELIKENSFRGYSGEEFSPEGLITQLNFSLDTDLTQYLNDNLAIDSELILKIRINEFDFEPVIPVTILINAAGGFESEYLSAYFPKDSIQDINTSNPVTVSLFSDEDSATTQFELERKNIGTAELTLTEIELNSDSDYLKENTMQSAIEVFEDSVIGEDGLIIDFTAFLSSLASTIKEEKIELGEITLTFDIDGTPDFIVLPFKVEILYSEDTLEVFPEELNYVFDLETEVYSQTKTLNFKSDSNFLSLTLADIEFDLDSTYVLPIVPIYLNPITNEGQDIDFTLNLTADGKEIKTSKYFEGEVLIEYSVAGRDFNKTIPLTVSILTPPKEITSDSFNLQACVGEGALNQKKGNLDVSFWIGCNIGEGIGSGCSTEKPKIKLDWSFDSFSLESGEDYTANATCSKDLLEYENYTYCDAAQFSMELVYRILKFKDGNPDKEGTIPFKATLISDNFSDDFFSDFDLWATSNALQTPTDYTNSSKYDLVRKYFAEGLINVNVFDKSGGTSGTAIEVPGWYDVNANVEKESLELNFTLRQTSSDLEGITGLQDSAFYYIPFDGEIGLKEGKFQRNNYGSSFDVIFPRGNYKINEIGFSIFSSDNLNGFKTLQAIQFDDFTSLNENFYKSALLEAAIDTSNLRTIKFYPSTPTPLIMQANLNRTGNSLIYYSIWNSPEERREAVESETLISWAGLGEDCVDFSGNSIKGNTYSDEKADSSDELMIQDSENAFKLYWPATKTGKSFFSSVVYFPVNAPLSYLKIIPFKNPDSNPFKVTLYSDASYSNPENPQQNLIPLNSSSFNLDSLKDLFDLVDEGYACFKNTGNFSFIVWNKEKIIEEAGIESEFDLDIDSECIQN